MKRLRSISRSIGALLVLGCCSADADDKNEPLDLGPFKFATGLQDNGGLGVILTGTDGGEIGWFDDDEETTEPGAFFRGTGFYQLMVNGGWQSATADANSAEIALRTSLGTYIGYTTRLSGDGASTCDEVSVVPVEASDTPTRGKIPACILVDREYVLTTVFVDYAHRDATLVGVRVRQQTVSGGLAFWYTDAVRASNNIVDLYPKLTIGYNHATALETDLPAAPTVSVPDYLVARASLRLRLPTLADLHVGSRFLVDVDSSYFWATGNNPTGADGAAHTIQLMYDTGDSMKPALVYRSGEERAVEYDRQVLLGLVTDFQLPSLQANRSAGGTSAPP